MASLTTTGCANKLSEPDEYSGFLKDYSRLTESQSASGVPVMRWIDPKLDLSRYTSFYITLVTTAVSTASGARDQETNIATEAVFLDGATQQVVAQVVRKGTGAPLENDSKVMKATDMKRYWTAGQVT